jgi:hypothetical protein
MGYYLQTGQSLHGKAQIIADEHGGEIVDQATAEVAMSDPTKAVICVVNNGPFEAAAFAYDMAEFREFTRPDETRPQTFVVMDREIAKRESGYTGL